MSILTFIAGFCAAVSVGFDLINHCRDQRSTSDKKELTLGYSDIWVEENPDYNQDVFQKLGIHEPLREILDAKHGSGAMDTIERTFGDNTRRPWEAPEDD